MNWKDCAKLNDLRGQSRFEWPLGDGKSGFDCNQAFTFNDVWGAISWVWTWPGDYLLNIKAVRAFFETGPETFIGSNWSTAIGWLLLPLLLLPIGFLSEFGDRRPVLFWVILGGGGMLLVMFLDTL